MIRDLTDLALELASTRKKPILGSLTAALVYLAATMGLDLDPSLAATIAGSLFAIVVERSTPVFGNSATVEELERAHRRSRFSR